MLKDLRFSGAYHDNSLSVNITMETPADYGFDAATLLFSVMVRPKSSEITALTLKDFSFYVMDESSRLYNTQSTSVTAVGDASSNQQPVYHPDWLIHTDFQYDFLYQNLRIAFHHSDYMSINIIELRH